MALWTDLRDWVGGLPYEYATADEIIAFCRDHLGFELVNLLPVSSVDTGNNQFVFRRTGR